MATLVTAVIKEASSCLRWEWTQRPTTGQCEVSERLHITCL